jgi:putative oxidoreductase
MHSALARVEAPAYALLRFVAGAMFSCHGMQKLLGLYATGARPAVGSQIWVGGIIELVGGVLIALGLFTRLAAFLAAGTMAVAYFQFHWKLQLNQGKWLPLVNKGELAALYCFVFLFIAARGAGVASLDRRLRRG